MSTIYGNLQSDAITYVLPNEVNKLGRNPLTNNIVLTHQSISKDHALIEFDKNRNAFISDMHSSNGTFVNGRKIPSTSKIPFNQNDIVKFGKDNTVYKFNNLALSISSNKANSTMYSSNANYLYKSLPNNPRELNSLESKVYMKQAELDSVSMSFAQLNDEFNKLNAKHNALLQYASDIQKKNDFLELTIKEKNEKIEKLEKNDNNRILLEKEAMIKILQNENMFYNTELQKIKQCFNSQNVNYQLDLLINEYLTQISTLKRINEEYKMQFATTERKWNELLKTNESLNIQIEAINKKWNEDNERYIALIQQNDLRLNDALNQIPQCYDRFNINKEQAAKYLVEQVDIYLNEKANLLHENSVLNRRICDLMYENEKLKDEICINATRNLDFNSKALIEKNTELSDAIINLQNAIDPEKKINFENTFKSMGDEINKKDQLIQELKEKLAQAMHNSNLFFDEKQVVNSISQALKSRDEQIEQLKNKLQSTSIDNNNTNIVNDANTSLPLKQSYTN